MFVFVCWGGSLRLSDVCVSLAGVDRIFVYGYLRRR